MGQVRRSRKIRASRPVKSDEQLGAELAARIGVPAEQIARGGLVPGKVVDLSGELGERMTMIPVLLNRGGTAIERWLSSDAKRPSAQRLFGEHEERAIRYCQGLWTRAEGLLAAIDPTRDRVWAPLGWSQQEAMTELSLLQDRVPAPFWRCYENVVRFDEEAGAAGSSLATNSRSAVDAAKTTVAYTASLIAMWRRL